MPGFKKIQNYLWPADDMECAAVVFQRVVDLQNALAYVPHKRVALQAGGNCGVWPNYLADRFRTVYSFEPEPDNFRCLAANTKPNVICLQAALGQMRGGVSLCFPEGKQNYGACQVNGVGPIPSINFDDLRLGVIDFIQLDIEGYEPLALWGMWDTVQRYHPVLMIEDKGHSEKYGFKNGWSTDGFLPKQYKFKERVERDNIFVWED